MSSELDEDAKIVEVAVKRVSFYCCGCVGLLCGTLVTIVAIIAYVSLHK